MTLKQAKWGQSSTFCLFLRDRRTPYQKAQKIKIAICTLRATKPVDYSPDDSIGWALPCLSLNLSPKLLVKKNPHPNNEDSARQLRKATGNKDRQLLTRSLKIRLTCALYVFPSLFFLISPQKRPQTLTKPGPWKWVLRKNGTRSS